MGVGVFTHSEDSLDFMIPFDAYMSEEAMAESWEGDPDLARMEFENAVTEILASLPDSFEDVQDRRIWDGRHTRIIAENGFVRVGLTEWECNDLFVSFIPRDDDERFDWGINPLAYAARDSAHDKAARRLSRIWDLRVRTSGYTTAPLAA